MADTTITSLLDAITPDGTEKAVIDQDGQTVKITLADLVGAKGGDGSDGHYVRLPNGVQIAWGYAGYGTEGTWEFPVPFDSTPAIMLTGSRSDGTTRSVSYNTNETNASQVVWSASGDTGIRVFAIGTWS